MGEFALMYNKYYFINFLSVLTNFAKQQEYAIYADPLSQKFIN